MESLGSRTSSSTSLSMDKISTLLTKSPNTPSFTHTRFVTLCTNRDIGKTPHLTLMYDATVAVLDAVPAVVWRARCWPGSAGSRARVCFLLKLFHVLIWLAILGVYHCHANPCLLLIDFGHFNPYLWWWILLCSLPVPLWTTKVANFWCFTNILRKPLSACQLPWPVFAFLPTVLLTPPISNILRRK